MLQPMPGNVCWALLGPIHHEEKIDASPSLRSGLRLTALILRCAQDDSAATLDCHPERSEGSVLMGKFPLASLDSLGYTTLVQTTYTLR